MKRRACAGRPASGESIGPVFQRRALAVLLIFAAGERLALAEAPPAPGVTPRQHVATLTLDLLAVATPLSPFVHLDSELRLARKFSLRLGVGYGGRPRDIPKGAPASVALAWDARLEPRWYPLGGFEEGVHLGFLTTFERVLGGPVSGGIDPPPGLAMGPTVGFKSTSFPLIDVDAEIGPLLAIDRAGTAPEGPRVTAYVSFALGRSF